MQSVLLHRKVKFNLLNFPPKKTRKGNIYVNNFLESATKTDIKSVSFDFGMINDDDANNLTKHL